MLKYCSWLPLRKRLVGGEYVGVSDGAPPCAAVVIYKNAGDKDLAAFLAASVYARAP